MDARPLLQMSIVLMAAAAAAYYGLGDWQQDVVSSEDASGPDYVADNIAMSEVDAQGQLSRRLDGQRLTHHPEPELFVLEQPHMQLYRNSLPAWDVHALRATSPDPGHDVWLSGQVSAVRDARLGPPLQLATTRLHADPRNSTMDTPEPVRITGPQGTVTGTGMQADLKRNTLELLSAVEVRYAPSY